MTVEEKAYNYASKVVKNRLTASEVAAHYGRGYIEGQEDMKQLGWHPASELPEEDGEYITIMSNSLGEHGEICFNDFSNGEWRYTGYDWEPREVLLWCYPPKED